jgi:hypothetical protein
VAFEVDPAQAVVLDMEAEMGRRYKVDEARATTVAMGGTLEVTAWAKGWYDPGVLDPVDDAYPPEEDVELEVIKVEFILAGLRWDLTAAYLAGDEPELQDLVDDALATAS